MILPSQLAAPTTESAGYFEISSALLTDWLIAELGPAWTRRRYPAGTLHELLLLIKPQAPLSRYLLVRNGRWTVLLNNGPIGTDLGVLPWYATRDLACRSVRATASAGKHPATILEVYDPGAHDPFFCQRAITVADDGGKWVFLEHGERFTFEDQAAYRRRSIRNRFTPEMLDRYLRALGVPADQEPQTALAILVERVN
jgi:hypothetical protein